MATYTSVTDVTPLHLAAKYGDLTAVRRLLESNRYNVDCTDSNGQTPLHYACAAGHLDVIWVMVVEFSADTNARDDENNTPLHVAALSGNKEVVSFLINGNIEAKGASGRSLLHLACKGDNLSLVQSLIYACKRVNLVK